MTEEQTFNEPNGGYVTVSIKKSSSKDGNIGFDIDVNVTPKTTEANVIAMCNLASDYALKTSIKVRGALGL